MNEVLVLKKKTLILISTISLSLFLILLIFVSLNHGYFDLQISKELVNLKPNARYTESIFGRIFEVGGEIPAWIFGAFLMIGLGYYFYLTPNLKLKKTLITLTVIFGVMFYTIVFYRISHNWARYYGGEESPWYHLFSYALCFHLAFALIFEALSIYIVLKLNLPPKQVLMFFIVAAIALLFSEVLVHLIKPLMTRNRYRGMNYLGGDFSYFTPWYIKGNVREVVGAISDDFKSFPSGHTCSAASTFILALLPMFFKKFNKLGYKIFFFIFPIIYTFTVAFARIYVGAHFLSDVLIGGAIMYFSILISYLVYYNLLKKQA